MQIISIIRAIGSVYTCSFSRWAAKGLIGIILITLCSTSEVKAQPGELDPTFGLDGKVATGFGIGSDDLAFGLAIQTDGKIVAVGYLDIGGGEDFALARYNTDGSLDTSFGTEGLVITNFSLIGSSDIAFAVAIQTDGKIVVAGVSDVGGSQDFAIVRYNPDGSLDSSFGIDGVVTTDFSGNGSQERGGFAIAIQTDGKIIVGGESDSNGTRDFALARYNTDGSPDGSFGSGGLVITDFSGSTDVATGLGIQTDGKVVAAGFTRSPINDGSHLDFALARYNADGSPDTGFGNGGVVITDFNNSALDDLGSALAIQSDDKIIVSGRSRTEGSDDFALARYNTDGSLDNSFGSGGISVTDLSSGGGEIALALAIQTDGKIVAAGVSSEIGGDPDFALARYNIDGTLDTSFGSEGIVITDFGGMGREDTGTAVRIQTDGKIVVGGRFFDGVTEDFALARYLASVPPPMPDVEPCDANGDGNINILDVTGILNDILGIATAPGDGDCNEDGELNILDVTSVLNVILGPAPTPAPTAIPMPTATPIPTVTPTPTAPPLDGAALYLANCQGCHGPNGEGGAAPNVQGKLATDIQNAIDTVLAMSGIDLTPEEIQAIANFLGQF